MVNLRAYKEWKALFDENVANVWQKESIPVLRKLSMMLFSIKNEIKKIQSEVDNDISNLRKNVIEAQKQNVSGFEPSYGSNNNKENIQLNKNVTKPSQSTNFSQNLTVDSPEMFQNAEAPLSGSNDSESIIISDEDTTVATASNSPEIKKMKRNHASHKHPSKVQKLKDRSSPTMSFLRDLVNNHKCDDGFQQNDDKREQTNITEDKSSMDFFKELIGSSQKSKESVKEDSTDIPHKNDSSEVKSKEQNRVSTPLRNDSDVDLSIVQCTPVSILLPRRKDKTSYLSKKKSNREKGVTLTQMFSRHESRKNKQKEIRVPATNYDSDETYFDPASGSKTSEIGSVMGITRMVSYLNTDSPLKEKDVTQKEMKAQKVLNLDPDTQEIADLVGDLGDEDFEDDISLNSAVLEENENEGADVSQSENQNEETGVPQGLNEFLAKAQDVPAQLEAAPVVRGKARQKLPGWSCKDCEKFYLNQGLNPDQMLALNKCSKHRGTYRPREDTLPGFWNMNIETENTQ